MEDEILSVKSMEKGTDVEQIIKDIINEARISEKMRRWIGFDVDKEFQMNMYRNIDIKDGMPFNVWIKNINNGVQKKINHVGIMQEMLNDKDTILTKTLLECNFHEMDFKPRIASKLKKMIKEERYEYQHEQIGWDEINGSPIFKLCNIIKSDSTIASKYIGGLRIKRKGCYEEYIKGIKELIIGNTYLELAWCVSVAGVISSTMGIDDTNLVINYYGESSSGKTITSKIMLSMWSLASKLFMSFNSTDNEMERKFGQYKILPAVIDDKLVSISGEVNEKRSASKLAEQLFRLSEGHVRGRMNSKDSLLEYNCPVIMTSETSIVEAMAQTNTFGQYHRFIEIQCKKGQLTQDEEHANQIEALLEETGGVAGERFVQYFMNRYSSKEELTSQYYRVRGGVIKILKSRGISVRAANRIAMIMLAAELVKECFRININLGQMQELLLNSMEKAYVKAQSLDKYYIKFIDYCNNHPQCFVSNVKEGEVMKHFGHIKKDETGRIIAQLQTKTINFIFTGKEPEEYFKWLEIEKEQKENDKDCDGMNTKPNKGSITDITKISSNEFNNIISKWNERGYLKRDLAKTSKGARTTKVVLFSKEKQDPVYTIYMDCGEDK